VLGSIHEEEEAAPVHFRHDWEEENEEDKGRRGEKWNQFKTKAFDSISVQ